jgi:hypothetical protein
MSNKIINGQFFTTTNPFTLVPFLSWLSNIPEVIKKETTILEPFAGANNIPAMFADLNLVSTKWDCYDIEPPKTNNYPSSNVIQRNTIKNFPRGYKLSVTNPPYLGKTSAATKKLPFPDTKYDDLYKVCLECLLDNVDYVAAIIPETFIISGEFTDRLDTVISLTCKMFDDTKCPVCLALFNPTISDTFKIYRMNDFLGTQDELQGYIPKPFLNHYWKINDPQGIIGIKCVDSNDGPSVRFCRGEEIDSSKIKISSRSETRVSGLYDDINLDLFISTCNRILSEYRIKTEDAFMAPFKNLRKDMKYRRRLDFATAKLIMSKAVEELTNASYKEHKKVSNDIKYQAIDLFNL